MDSKSSISPSSSFDDMFSLEDSVLRSIAVDIPRPALIKQTSSIQIRNSTTARMDPNQFPKYSGVSISGMSLIVQCPWEYVESKLTRLTLINVSIEWNDKGVLTVSSLYENKYVSAKLLFSRILSSPDTYHIDFLTSMESVPWIRNLFGNDNFFRISKMEEKVT